MNQVRFSHNWNSKLSQKIFTTIRKYDYKKWNFYKGAEGSDFRVVLNDEYLFTAILLNAECDRLCALPQALICVDTGNLFKQAMMIFKKFGIDKQEQCIVLTFMRRY